MKRSSAFMVSLLLTGVLLFSSCEKWNPGDDEPGRGWGGKDPKACSLSGTLVRISCTVSDLDDLWIKADDGKYYQPCDASKVHVMDISYRIVPGTRIRFGYEVMTSGSLACDNEKLILCASVPPPAKKIRITCMQPL